MAQRDLYDILQVERRASAKDIKRAYYKLALVWHPDAREQASPDDDARFAEIAEAYAVLGDEKMRKRYDALGPWAKSFGPTSRSPLEALMRDPRRMRMALEQTFSQLEQQAAELDQRRHPERTAAHAGTLSYVTNMVTHWARTRRDRGMADELDQDHEGPHVACEACRGTGSAPGAQQMTCSLCQGCGEVRWKKGWLKLARKCSACHGRGKRPDLPCPLCCGRSTP